MEQSFYEKQGRSVLDEHNSQPADYTIFLSEALRAEAVEKLMRYLSN
jgi:hypothetical protein